MSGVRNKHLHATCVIPDIGIQYYKSSFACYMILHRLGPLGAPGLAPVAWPRGLGVTATQSQYIKIISFGISYFGCSLYILSGLHIIYMWCHRSSTLSEIKVSHYYILATLYISKIHLQYFAIIKLSIISREWTVE